MIDRLEEYSGRKVEYNFASARPGDQMFYVTNHDKLTRMTGWAPHTPLHETVWQIARWWKANQELFGKVHAESDEFAPSLEAVQEPA